MDFIINVHTPNVLPTFLMMCWCNIFKLRVIDQPSIRVLAGKERSREIHYLLTSCLSFWTLCLRDHLGTFVVIDLPTCRLFNYPV